MNSAEKEGGRKRSCFLIVKINSNSGRKTIKSSKLVCIVQNAIIRFTDCAALKFKYSV